MAVAWAVAGVLGGHVLTYTLLFPDAAMHDAVLATTGHEWLKLAGPAILVAIASFVGAAVLAARGTPSRSVRFAVLGALQVGAFVGIELGERLASGMAIELLPHQLFDHGLAPILLVGSVIQVLAAWLGSAASRIIERIAARHRRRALHPRRAAARRFALRFAVVLDTHVSARPIRGPPLDAISASAT
jgi:hypothetical protein